MNTRSQSSGCCGQLFEEGYRRASARHEETGALFMREGLLEPTGNDLDQRMRSGMPGRHSGGDSRPSRDPRSGCPISVLRLHYQVAVFADDGGWGGHGSGVRKLSLARFVYQFTCRNLYNNSVVLFAIVSPASKSLCPGLHPRVTEVTARIVARSADSRGPWLERVAQAGGTWPRPFGTGLHESRACDRRQRRR